MTHLTLWRSVGFTLATLRRWRGYVCALFRFDSRHFFLLSWLDLAMWILGSRLSVDGSKAMIPALPFLRDFDVNSIMFLIHNHIFPTDPNAFWGRFRVWLRGSIAGSIGSSLDYDLRMIKTADQTYVILLCIVHSAKFRMMFPHDFVGYVGWYYLSIDLSPRSYSIISPILF